MSLDVDHFLDRRRLKRQLTFWRVLGVVLLGALIVGLGARFDVLEPDAYVARVAVEGVIVDDRDQIDMLGELADDPAVSAVVLAVDSPGGTYIGGDRLFDAIQRLSREKPVVAVMGGTATSAGYLVAIAADHVIARPGTVTGSIGVILQTADVTGLLDNWGIKPETLKSGPLKAQPNPLEPFSDEARQATEAVLLDLYRQFVDVVAERRGLDQETVLKLADGRVFTGRQALAERLVDTLGGEAEALDWLEREKGVPGNLPVRDVETEDGMRIAFERARALFKNTLFSERLKLDGVISVWHPAL